ncbi:MAG: hypothetical protein Q9195_004160 [Heterodermia aff. obscurata]
MSTQTDATHVLIVGAGITGLAFAQALRNHGVSFTIYERDPDPSYRGRGWGLTIHWALDTLLSLLPQDIIDRLPETYVDPEAVARGEKGTFPFFDLRSGDRRWELTSPNRIRVGRERLRRLLMEGIDVKWSHTLTSVTHPTPLTVTAHFSTPSSTLSAIGTLLLGADGTHSTVRSHLLPHPLSTTTRLPIRFLGTTTRLPAPLALSLKALDPFFFQGGDPLTNVFLYFSFFSTPNQHEEGQREAQFSLSYPYRPGFWGQDHAMEVPAERVALMKAFAEGWVEPFRELVMSLAEDSAVKELVVEDFLPEKGIGERVALVGDAGHAMTIYRGEAANHGIMDVAVLLSHILPILKGAPSTTSTATIQDAISAYEKEMIARTRPAVLASRRAAMDAHDYARIDGESPLVSKRVVVREE